MTIWKTCLALRRYMSTSTMAKSKFEYVKTFEREDHCLPNCWIVIRVDGKNFSKFSDCHQFEKPNDLAALQIMSRAATTVMENIREIVLSYGQSDEYSFVFKKNTQLYNRRVFKLVTNINSLFASSYVYYWNEYFPNKKLLYPPSFDARIVLYPSDKNLRDYLSWRQADTHINNLYNTCFWNLILKKNMTPVQAQQHLKGTLSADKNELLFKEFGINYNNEPQIFRKGTTLLRKTIVDDKNKAKYSVIALTDDIIRDKFWKDHPEILNPGMSQEIRNSISDKNTSTSSEPELQKELQS